FIAGITVFSTVGFLAAQVGASVDQISAQYTLDGPGLAFKTYPAAIAKLPHFAGFFGVLFFVMLLFLGTTSLISLVEAVVCGIRDKFGTRRKVATTVICLCGLGVGLLFASRAGLYWLDIVDHWTNSYGLTMVGLAECILIGWFYKARVLREFANGVSEVRLGKWWDICIKYITPAILIVTVSYSLIQEFTTPYESYDLWPRLVGGWFLITVIVAISVILMKAKSPGSKIHKSAIFLFIILGELSLATMLDDVGMKASSWIILFFGFTLLLGTLLSALGIAFANERKKKERLIKEQPPVTM
ncbi:MAG: hypothetical protein GY855_05815, partial [candidate division Zixibacteria bacterium]|nr:hypothetical protein [candidate division Zixibacteria bacterium]